MSAVAPLLVPPIAGMAAAAAAAAASTATTASPALQHSAHTPSQPSYPQSAPRMRALKTPIGSADEVTSSMHLLSPAASASASALGQAQHHASRHDSSSDEDEENTDALAEELTAALERPLSYDGRTQAPTVPPLAFGALLNGFQGGAALAHRETLLQQNNSADDSEDGVETLRHIPASRRLSVTPPEDTGAITAATADKQRFRIPSLTLPTPNSAQHHSSSSQSNGGGIGAQSVTSTRGEGSGGFNASAVQYHRESSSASASSVTGGAPGGLRSKFLELKLICPSPEHVHAPPAMSKEDKLLYFSRLCSVLTDNLAVGSRLIAQDWKQLAGSHITHVVNCAGDICENYFEGFCEPLVSPASSNNNDTESTTQNLSPPPTSSHHSSVGSLSPLHAASLQTRPIKYLRLFLLDTQDEDLMAVVYPVLEFVEAARAEGPIQLSAAARAGLEQAARAAEAKAAANAALTVLHHGTDSASTHHGVYRHEPESATAAAAAAAAERAVIPTSICPRVLIHCQQGVSRSTALCIAYLMLDGNREYEEAYAMVRSIRGITRPNFGFIAQLKAWKLRMQGWEAAAAAQERNAIESRSGSDAQRAAALARTLPPSMHLYRAAPHCSRDRRIVLKLADSPTAASVDSRSIFLLSTQHVLYIWVGALVLPQQEAAYMVQIWKQVARLRRFEHASAFHVVLRQKEEMRWNTEEMDRRRREFQDASLMGTEETQIGVREVYEVRAPATAAPTPTNLSRSARSFSPSPDVPPETLERSPSQTLFLQTLMSPNTFHSLVSMHPTPPPPMSLSQRGPQPTPQQSSRLREDLAAAAASSSASPSPRSLSPATLASALPMATNSSPGAQSRSLPRATTPSGGSPAAQGRSVSPALSQQHVKSQSAQLLSPVKDAAATLTSPSKPPMHPQSASLAASPNAGFLRGDSSGGGGGSGSTVPAAGSTTPARSRAISPGSSPSCSPHRPPRQLNVNSASPSSTMSPAPGSALSSSAAAVAATPTFPAASPSPSPLPPLPSPPAVISPVDPASLSWQEHSRQFWSLLNGSPATELLVSEYEEDYPAHEWMALHLMTQAAAASHPPSIIPNERRKSKTDHGGHSHAGSSGAHLGTPLLRSRAVSPQPAPIAIPPCMCHITPCVCGHRLDPLSALATANLDALPAPVLGKLDMSRRNSRDSRRNSITAAQQRRRSSAASTSAAAAAAAALAFQAQQAAATAAGLPTGPPSESVSRCTSRTGTDGMSITLLLPTTLPLAQADSSGAGAPQEVETLALFPPAPLPVTPSRPRHRHARSQSYDGDDEDTDVDLMRGMSDASNPATASDAEQALAPDTLSVASASPPLHPRTFIVVGSTDEKSSRPHSRLQPLDTDEEVTTEDDGSPVSADAAAAAASRAASLLYAAGSARGSTGAGASGGSRFVSPRLNPLFIGLGEPVPPGFVANSGLELRADSSDSEEEDMHEANAAAAAGFSRGFSRNGSGVKGASPLPGGRRLSGSTRATPVKSGNDSTITHVHTRRPSDSTRHATIHHAATLPTQQLPHPHTTTHHHSVSAAASLALHSPRAHGIIASVSFSSPVQPNMVLPPKAPPLVPVLWSYPAVEELSSFDLDDLHSDEVFVLQWVDASASRKHRRGVDDSDESTSDSDEEVAEVRNLRLRALSASAAAVSGSSPRRPAPMFSPSAADSNGSQYHSSPQQQQLQQSQQLAGSHPPPPPFDHLSVSVSSTSASPPAVRSMDGTGVGGGGGGGSSTLSQSSQGSMGDTPGLTALHAHASALPPLHVVSPPTAFSPDAGSVPSVTAPSPLQQPLQQQQPLRPIHVWFGSNARTGASRLSESEMQSRARAIVADFIDKRRKMELDEREVALAAAAAEPNVSVSFPPLESATLALDSLEVRVEREGSESAHFLDGFQDG